MAKSLGNDYTLRDIVAQGVDPRAIRYLLFSVPYRKQLNFTFEGLKGAETTVERLQDFYTRLKAHDAKSGSSEAVRKSITRSVDEFEAAMDDDLNTSVALAAIHNLVREINTAMAQELLFDADKQLLLETIGKFDSVLNIFGTGEQSILDEEIEALIEERNEARRSRNFARSDEIRDLLNERGIVLEDTKDGVRWKRK
jgi:cysteinyl-tRNA synthetase